MKKIFITATDTDAGKTHIGSAIVKHLVNQNLKVKVFKPISAGCEIVNDKLINEDAAKLLQQSNCQQSIENVNPIAFLPPIAPHIAAQQTSTELNVATITEHFNRLIANDVDVIISEGAGGWRLPLGNGEYLSAFAQQTQQAIILVVNMKLGCLNHALLTYEAIEADGLSCIGWVANVQEDMPYLTENIATLKAHFTAPLFGVVSFEPDLEKLAKQLDLSSIAHC